MEIFQAHLVMWWYIPPRLKMLQESPLTSWRTLGKGFREGCLGYVWGPLQSMQPGLTENSGKLKDVQVQSLHTSLHRIGTFHLTVIIAYCTCDVEYLFKFPLCGVAILLNNTVRSICTTAPWALELWSIVPNQICIRDAYGLKVYTICEEHSGWKH